MRTHSAPARSRASLVASLGLHVTLLVIFITAENPFLRAQRIEPQFHITTVRLVPEPTSQESDGEIETVADERVIDPPAPAQPTAAVSESTEAEPTPVAAPAIQETDRPQSLPGTAMISGALQDPGIPTSTVSVGESLDETLTAEISPLAETRSVRAGPKVEFTGDRIPIQIVEKPVIPSGGVQLSPGVPPVSAVIAYFGADDSGGKTQQSSAQLSATPPTRSDAPEPVVWHGRIREEVKCETLPYPEIMRKDGFEADVVARIYVSPSGFVTAVQIVSSSGYRLVDSDVENALRNCEFEPAEGTSNDVGTKRVQFRLERRN